MPIIHDLKLVTRIASNSGDNKNIIQEISCYSLPYGALGFVSHVLTYYTLGCLWAGHSPLWPGRKVEYTRVDLGLGVVGLCVSMGLAIRTLVKCRDTWQLLVIAVWKLTMSLLNDITAVQVAIVIFMNDESHSKVKKAAWWILLYIPGMFAGMVGLMSLVVQHHDHKNVMKLTAVFYTLVGIGVVMFFLAFCCRGSGSGAEGTLLWGLGGLSCSVALFTVLAAFYSDWALGMMAGNIVGLPSGGTSVLYWTYFVAKRLSMLSWVGSSRLRGYYCTGFYSAYGLG